MRRGRRKGEGSSSTAGSDLSNRGAGTCILDHDGHDNEDGDDDDDDESITCRPKSKKKLNEKPAKYENLKIEERKCHLFIIINGNYYSL